MKTHFNARFVTGHSLKAPHAHWEEVNYLQALGQVLLTLRRSEEIHANTPENTCFIHLKVVKALKDAHAIMCNLDGSISSTFSMSVNMPRRFDKCIQ